MIKNAWLRHKAGMGVKKRGVNYIRGQRCAQCTYCTEWEVPWLRAKDTEARALPLDGKERAPGGGASATPSTRCSTQ